MARTQTHRLGIRGRLILGVLLIVGLSLWLLGAMLLRQNAAFLTAERRARGRAIATAVEKSLSTILRGEGRFPAGGPAHAAIRDLLGALAEDPAVGALALRDAEGRVVAAVGAAVADPGDASLSLPLRPAGAPAGFLAIRFAAQGFGRQAAYAHLQVLVQLGITAVVLVVFIHLLVTVSVAAPIRRLVAATERVAGGDLDRTVEEERPDELGDLASSFNLMLMRLRQARELNERQLESLRRAHEDLVEKEEALVLSEKLAAVGRVAAGVAHEVGNPLGAVTGYLALLGRGDLAPEEARDYLRRMEAEISRINRIMLDLLEYARAPRMEWTAVDLGALLGDLGQQLAGAPDFRSVTLHVDAAPDLPAVRADYHRTRQMLLNLALNAAQAMSGGGTVTLETFRPAEEGFAAAVRVRDDGPGIPAEVLPHLFEPFTTAGKGGRGTGLGLAICKRTAEAMGARISVETAPGAGTSFTILFRVE